MLSLQCVNHVYTGRQRKVSALQDIDLRIGPGEFVVLRGPSGCGKSTLLMVAGGLLTPTSGEVELDGRRPYALSETQRDRFRAERAGFVFQLFHLLPFMSALDNVALPSLQTDAVARDQAATLLNRFGLGKRMSHLPGQLSTGERQRVAVARAMINQPAILFADEPTGSLDPNAAEEVFRALQSFVDDGGTVIMATHGIHPGLPVTRQLGMEAGKIVHDQTTTSADPILSSPAPGATRHAS